MGIITTFPDNSKRYVSTSGNGITIHRMYGGDLVAPGERVLYRVVGKFTMWTLFENDTVNETVGDLEVQLYVSEINGVKLQEQLYEQLKKNFYNYEDDYGVNRSSVKQEEEEDHVHTEEEAHVVEDVGVLAEDGAAAEDLAAAEEGAAAEDLAAEDVGVLAEDGAAEDAVAEPEV